MITINLQKNTFLKKSHNDIFNITSSAHKIVEISLILRVDEIFKLNHNS